MRLELDGINADFRGSVYKGMGRPKASIMRQSDFRDNVSRVVGSDRSVVNFQGL